MSFDNRGPETPTHLPMNMEAVKQKKTYCGDCCLA